jgi:phospholipid/cholesterol/gamma-HCH transport system ATP-binding protein
LIRQIVDDLEITAVTITHDISSVRAISDHVAFLHEGAIAWHGAAADLDGADHPLALREFISAYEA